MSKLLKWYVYELSSKESSLNGVKLRGRIRKFGIENDINVLAENTEDAENGVRFATLNEEGGERVSQYVRSKIGDVDIRLVASEIENPVLSKLKVNDKNRYEL